MKTILERIADHTIAGEIQIDEVPYVQRAIDDLKARGWTDDEIVSKLKWLEHVNPGVAEDVALRAMQRVDALVLARQRIQYAVDQTSN